MSLDGLSKYLPEGALELVNLWVKDYNILIKIKKPRDGKLGDYRKNYRGQPHQITLNNDLDIELFFLTLTHEIAHMHAFHFHKKIKPHGIEWKNIFGELILSSLHLYAEELQKLLKIFAKNPKAGYYASEDISSYFQQKLGLHELMVKDIKDGEEFKLNKRIFKKIKKNRTKYLCEETLSKKKYIIAGTAPVQKIENE